MKPETNLKEFIQRQAERDSKIAFGCNWKIVIGQKIADAIVKNGGMTREEVEAAFDIYRGIK
jgi:predicted transcriptional regulator